MQGWGPAGPGGQPLSTQLDPWGAGRVAVRGRTRRKKNGMGGKGRREEEQTSLHLIPSSAFDLGYKPAHTP